MSLIVVDGEKCKRDGLCVAVCPAGIIESREEPATPGPIENANELCLECGHCVAVCPHGALVHTYMEPGQCAPMRKEWVLDGERVEHFLRSRRSIRTFKDRPIERDLITKLIDIARFAPSGHNSQPVRWLVIYDSDEVRRLAGLVIEWMRSMLNGHSEIARGLHMDRVVASWEAGMDRVCRGAPHVIVTHAPKKEPTAQAACTIALSYLELAAPSFDLGACWAGYFNAAANTWPAMQDALGLPEGHISFGAMMIGHPMYQYRRLPLRNEPRVTWR